MTNAEFKRDVIRRIQKARADGISVGELSDICGYGVSIHTIYNLLGAEKYPIETWQQVSDGLEKIGY